MTDFIVLNTGQSPADGRGKNGREFNRLNSNIKVRNNVNNPIGSIGNAWVTPTQGSAPFSNLSGVKRNNIGIWLTQRIAEEFTDTYSEYKFVQVSAGGMSLNEWVDSSGTRVAGDQIRAIWADASLPPANLYIHHGHEEDVNQTDAQSIAWFEEDVLDLKADGVIDDDTVILIVGVPYNNTAKTDYNNNVLKPLVAANAQMHFVDTDAPVFDGYHIDGEAEHKLGYELAWEAVKTPLGHVAPTYGADIHSITRTATGMAIKYTDGRMECVGHFRAYRVSSSYMKGNWTYPAEFIGVPEIVYSIAAGDGVSLTFTKRTCLSPSYEPRTTDVDILIGKISGQSGSYGTTNNLPCSAIAKGYWK